MVQPPLLFVDVAEWQTRKIQDLVGNRVGSTPIIDTNYFNKKEELAMAIDIMYESMDFYQKYKLGINLIEYTYVILELVLLSLILVIPIIIIYKKVKLKNKPNDNSNYVIKTLKSAEFLFVFLLFLCYIIDNVLNNYAPSLPYPDSLYPDIFIILISFVTIGVVLYKLLKKQH